MSMKIDSSEIFKECCDGWKLEISLALILNIAWLAASLFWRKLTKRKHTSGLLPLSHFALTPAFSLVVWPVCPVYILYRNDQHVSAERDIERSVWQKISWYDVSLILPYLQIMKSVWHKMSGCCAKILPNRRSPFENSKKTKKTKKVVAERKK